MTDNEFINLRDEERKAERALKEKNAVSVLYELYNEKVKEIQQLKAEIESLKDSRDRWRRLAEDFDRITREEEKAAEG